MSEHSIPIIVTVVVIALMFAWVPLLNIICPPGWRSTEEPSDEKKEGEAGKKDREVRQERQSLKGVAPHPTMAAQAAKGSGLSSRRLRAQSHELHQAISGRGRSSHSRSATPHSSPAPQ